MLARPRDELDLIFVTYEDATGPPLGMMTLELLFKETPGCYLLPNELALY